MTAELLPSSLSNIECSSLHCALENEKEEVKEVILHLEIQGKTNFTDEKESENNTGFV